MSGSTGTGYPPSSIRSIGQAATGGCPDCTGAMKDFSSGAIPAVGEPEEICHNSGDWGVEAADQDRSGEARRSWRGSKR
jgi:hypothetical protein